MSLHLNSTMSKSAQYGRHVFPRFTGVTGRLRFVRKRLENQVDQRRDERAYMGDISARQHPFRNFISTM